MRRDPRDGRAPEVNNNDIVEDDEDDGFQLDDIEPDAAQQEDLYDYRKPRVTPLDGRPTSGRLSPN